MWSTCWSTGASVDWLNNSAASWGYTRAKDWISWWRHQMETFSALLAICAGNSPVSGEFPAQRPVTRSFDVFFDVRLIKRLSKHSRGWWFGTLSHPLWRHRKYTSKKLWNVNIHPCPSMPMLGKGVKINFAPICAHKNNRRLHLWRNNTVPSFRVTSQSKCGDVTMLCKKDYPWRLMIVFSGLECPGHKMACKK